MCVCCACVRACLRVCVPSLYMCQWVCVCVPACAKWCRVLVAMDSLPGMGTDVLRDIDMGQVLNYNCCLCIRRPIHPSWWILSGSNKNERHWRVCWIVGQYTSLTSRPINAHASARFSFTKIQLSEHSVMKLNHKCNHGPESGRRLRVHHSAMPFCLPLSKNQFIQHWTTYTLCTCVSQERTHVWNEGRLKYLA